MPRIENPSSVEPPHHPSRRTFLCLGISSLLVPSVHGQVDQWISQGRQLMENQIDLDAVQALAKGDLRQTETILRSLEDLLDADDLAPIGELQDWVENALPLLEAHPDTAPYASWLRARADYFEVAHNLTPQPAPTPPTKEKPSKRIAPAPVHPTPNQARVAWNKEVKAKAQPKGASAWLPRLKSQFRRSGVPTELAWLAEIESGFEPAARSPHGAAGMYQLMPATAQTMGLKTSPTDERLVPEKNAQAAATYLGQLHRQFKNWHLALAAYNAGPGRVSSTLKQRRATTFDAIAPSLPAETQLYVPRFEAVLQEREGKALAKLPAPTA
ncbi:MAG: lytic transglycosylase domain-containing protein [Verrucomicrobiales bacterium]|nr:lytic transglycosylase domain-containing protein [Verrucomicrobiales bacterium]